MMRVANAGCVLMLVVACGAQGPGASGGDDDTPPDAPPGDGGPSVTEPCRTPAAIPVTGRALDLMPPDRLAAIASRAPCIVDGAVRDVIESPRTFWYDKRSLVPGYQDSFGDNVVTPIGMRPNTIDPQLIDLAVPGGHDQIFVDEGTFHFPFGQPIGPADNVRVVNFWSLPEADGKPRPVVYWRRDPNSYTHRVEWMFPAGTVFGELLFVDEGGAQYAFEIRTRTRTLDGWHVDAYRPFPSASDLADAIEARRGERLAWASSPVLDELVAQLRGEALAPYRISATHFPGAFPAREAGVDVLPALAGSDAELMHELLRTTAFRSARGTPWKMTDERIAWAAGAAGGGAIVPRGYNAAAVEVSEASCDGCHRDAGRPFETWYPNIIAYGELWGNDEIFTWHPFTIARFVDGNGNVQNFNHDNREIRPDFRSAGLVAPYEPANHPATVYQRIVREWTDFVY